MILFKIELATERDHILRIRSSNESRYGSLRPTRSGSSTSKGSTRPGSGNVGDHRSNADELAEFGKLVKPIARKFARLERKERIRRRRTATTIIIVAFLGLVVATSFNNFLAGVVFFVLALYGTCIILSEPRIRR